MPLGKATNNYSYLLAAKGKRKAVKEEGHFRLCPSSFKSVPQLPKTSLWNPLYKSKSITVTGKENCVH